MEPDFSQELVGEAADVRGSVVQKQHGGKWYAALPQESQRRTVLHPLE